MDCILDWIGITDCYFYRLYRVARDSGPVFVTGNSGLSPPFHTGRGIRQGCPASPTLFALLLSGLEGWVSTHAAGCGICLGPSGRERAVLSYADDICLMAGSVRSLPPLFAAVSSYLSFFGLHMVAGECRAVLISA